TTSGWSAFSTTILAARRVFPPDLMTPADASAARMNDTGPEAVPPPPRRSFDERSRERFTPEPDPPLKMTPSLRYQSRIESIVSSTDRMKHAEHCGFGSTPSKGFAPAVVNRRAILTPCRAEPAAAPDTPCTTSPAGSCAITPLPGMVCRAAYTPTYCVVKGFFAMAGRRDATPRRARSDPPRRRAPPRAGRAAGRRRTRGLGRVERMGRGGRSDARAPCAAAAARARRPRRRGRQLGVDAGAPVPEARSPHAAECAPRPRGDPAHLRRASDRRL